MTIYPVIEIEQAVSQLSVEELARFRAWFAQFDDEIWDQKFEADAQSGKLDKIAERSLADYRAGKFQEL